MYTWKDVLDGKPLEDIRKATPPPKRCATPGCGDPVHEDLDRCYYCLLGDLVERHPPGLPRR